MGVKYEFEPQEVIALRNLLHIACQAKGMEVAEACVALDRQLLAGARAHEVAQQTTLRD